jgi:alkaline phosphatase
MKLVKFGITFFIIAFFSSSIFAQSFKDGKYEKDKKVDVFSLDTTYDVKNITPYDGEQKTAKNIILLIGDGMGVSHVFAGITANKNNTYFQQFTNIGFSKTASANRYTTDSAAGGTAISSGVKTNNGSIGVDTDNKVVKTILEIAEKNGKSTGMVATSSITHATPASFIAHQPSRKMYEEIANDFLATDIDIFIGGGKDNFDNRKDERNLLDSLKKNGYSVIDNLSDVEKFEGNKLAGLIYTGHPDGIVERGNMLVPATKKAIEFLNKKEKGFFLMIEGSQIDWAAHGNKTFELIGEVTDFDKAIGEALKFAEQDGNTLVIVTADHETGGFAVKSGSSEKGEVKGQFTSKGHTATMVPVFAYGPGADKFRGIYENTDIFHKMLEAYGLKVE